VGAKLCKKTGRIICLLVSLVFLHAALVSAQAPDFVLSPPVKAPAMHKPAGLDTDLRELIDARGLALLVVDDASARHLDALIKNTPKHLNH